MNDEVKDIFIHIRRQNETIISLLGRSVFSEDELKTIITANSSKPKAMLEAYNFCDGLTGLTEIAKKVPIAQSSLTAAVNKWEDNGIAIKHVNKDNTVFPQRLYKLKGI